MDKLIQPLKIYSIYHSNRTCGKNSKKRTIQHFEQVKKLWLQKTTMVIIVRKSHITIKKISTSIYLSINLPIYLNIYQKSTMAIIVIKSHVTFKRHDSVGILEFISFLYKFFVCFLIKIFKSYLIKKPF